MNLKIVLTVNLYQIHCFNVEFKLNFIILFI